ncbi:SIR2-domain-containing protein [Sistotremastrum suecicum HHB10207 ss-3]|uniref:SIR2-domain-containing protein n=1 Tax=Sistotremastrum suecicum HHB10207 ss-3 TaxID=1314776 RepID=A0A166HZV6_9AGAM|nr:SIR2-domain-containing protein [Sistotremastrum suecicum HHB10207 ss-3]
MHKILRRRERREEIWSPNHAIELIKSSKKIVVLTGAGISTSCGIPDFRSENGLYAELREKNEFDLEDPHQMFDIHYFKQHPHVFYSFAHKIYPSNFQPSPCHRFLALLEQKDKLLRNYTQNIDGLERKAGVQRVLQCHGSFSTATCVQCRTKVPGQDIEADILSQRVPYCRACAKAAPPRPKRKKAKKRKSGWQSDESEKEPPPNPSIMKPDITFFGEGLISDFDDLLSKDTEQADLLLIIGTSLQVAPVSEVVSLMPHSIPQVRLQVSKHIH